VTRIASSTSRRTELEVHAVRAGRQRAQQVVDVVAVAESVGTRPALVCGCASSPCSSRIASSLRIVDGAELELGVRTASVLEPTGCPVAL
jgi:hypothetical protein